MMLQGLFLRRKRFDFLRNSGSTGRASLARLVMDSSMFSGGLNDGGGYDEICNNDG